MLLRRQLPNCDQIDHIDYLAQKMGKEHVGIGSDFDGIERTPTGLENASKYPYLVWNIPHNAKVIVIELRHCYRSLPS